MAAVENATAVNPNSGLREKTGTTSDIIPIAGSTRM